ncbi:MAG: hypothetical protein RRZ24_07405 [Clostridia bacterium]
MLIKLMKHDFYALSRKLFPLQISVLSGGLLATIFMTIAIRIQHTAANNGIPLHGDFLMIASCTLSTVLIGLAIMASCIVTLLIICMHFYHNFMCSEGYLTFTLPTTTTNLMWSKLLTGTIWMLINFVVLSIAGLIFIVFGTASTGFANQQVLETLGKIFQDLLAMAQSINLPLAIFACIIWAVLSIVAMLLEIYFAIVVGGQIAKKNKLLAAIGMYLLINFTVGTIRTILQLLGLGISALTIPTTDSFIASTFLQNTVLVSIGINLLLSVIFFLWSKSILKRNLNLQ